MSTGNFEILVKSQEGGVRSGGAAHQFIGRRELYTLFGPNRMDGTTVGWSNPSVSNLSSL